MAGPKLTVTPELFNILGIERYELVLLAAVVHDDAERRQNWTAYNMWHGVLGDFYPKEK